MLGVFLTAFTVSLAKAQSHFIPAGTTLHCRLTQPISTKVNFQNDPFTAAVSEPLVLDGKHVIPVGSTIEGRVAWLVRPGRIRGVGEMRLDAEKVTLPDGRSFPLTAVLVQAYGAEGAKVEGEEGSLKGPSSRLGDLQEIGLGMGGGGFIGTMLGGAHGALIGGAIGGAAGLADTLRRRGKDLTLPTGTLLNYQLTRELVIQGSGTRESAFVREETIR
jgi:hypothetical protein